MENSGSFIPLRDLTNTTNGGRNISINSHVEVDNAKRRKRERERARYAAMSEEQRNGRNRKRRENRLRKKDKTTINDGPRGDMIYKFKPSLSIALCFLFMLLRITIL